MNKKGYFRSEKVFNAFQQSTNSSSYYLWFFLYDMT